MKTFTRIIRRYILAVTTLIVLFLALFVYTGYQYASTYPQGLYTSGAVADALTEQNGQLVFDPAHTPAEWMDGYEWAMVLDDDGNIIWSYQLPENLDHRYTSSQVASFTRWFLNDYPVFCWIQDYGLFVIALAPGSLWRYNVWMSSALIEGLIRSLPPFFLFLFLIVLGACLFFSWRSAKQLRIVSDGLDALANGQTVTLSTRGFTGELAEKLNQTSQQLQKRNELIARRDTARTNWIAGVSHDIRTPLSLILGWAEQLGQDAVLPESSREKASGICTQSEKIRSLIEDLNLTSNLQYGAQPLRCQPLTAGPFLRELAAQFCESPLAGSAAFELYQTPEAERSILNLDKALLTRAVENLLGNSVRHNPAPVSIRMETMLADGQFRLTVTDNGRGYPPTVLAALQDPETPDPPHILGLHVVEQILQAHGGHAVFGQNVPKGAKSDLFLPLQKISKQTY